MVLQQCFVQITKWIHKQTNKQKFKVAGNLHGGWVLGRYRCEDRDEESFWGQAMYVSSVVFQGALHGLKSCKCVCESYIGKPIGTRAVPQFTTGVAKPLTQIEPGIN